MSDNSHVLPKSTAPFAWRVSIGFWLCLLFSATLYGLVALAPKLSGWLELRNDFYTNQVRLVELEDQVDYLDRVAAALEDDPDFALELARLDLHATRPGDETIPVDAQLTPFLATDPLWESAAQNRQAWYLLFVELFAQQRVLRSVTLGLAALIVMLAFTFLHDAHEQRVQTCLAGVKKAASRAFRRYRSGLGP